MSCKKSPWDKLLVLARLVDSLEQDFQEIYPDEEKPMAGGCEAALRQLFGEKFGGK